MTVSSTIGRYTLLKRLGWLPLRLQRKLLHHPLLRRETSTLKPFGGHCLDRIGSNGIVRKRKNSPYKAMAKPSRHWIKVKNSCYRQLEGARNCSSACETLHASSVR